MTHSDADRNFWVRTVIGFFAMLMVGGCVLKYGDTMDWVGWLASAIVFLLIVLAIILPPKTYIGAIQSINLAGIFAAIKSIQIFGKKEGTTNGINPPPGSPTDPPKPPGT